jgi:hypothetical protein
VKKFNKNIPGWMSESDLIVLQTLSGYVPENGSILEIGCFLGRSTSALFAGKHDSVKLTVVDTFEYNSEYSHNLIHMPDKIDGDQELFMVAAKMAIANNSWEESFKLCMGSNIIDNIELHCMPSTNFSNDIKHDMVFIDANHDTDSLVNDIARFIDDCTLIVGDDFTSKWAKSIPPALAITKKKYNWTLVMPENTKIWFMIPPSGKWKEIFKINNIFF